MAAGPTLPIPVDPQARQTDEIRPDKKITGTHRGHLAAAESKAPFPAGHMYRPEQP